MKRACLIGLGMITQRYIQGLGASDYLNICAVSDLNENAISRPFFDRYPYYADYKQMLAEKKPDYVIISTPPQSHFDIAYDCLDKGVNVIIEKPVALDIASFDALAKLAQEKNLVFRTLFHWHGGIETIAFTRNYNLSRIQEIRVSVADPYCADGETINTDRRPLMGAWIDSGVNVLSMLRLWLPLKQVEILDTQVQRCKQTNLPIYVNVKLIADGVPTEITIDWRLGKDSKQTLVKLDDRWVRIGHSEQCIEDVDVTQYARMPRLEEHYKHLLGTFDGSSNADLSRSVHEILFKVRESL